MRKIISLTQKESLRARERETITGIPLVTTYNQEMVSFAIMVFEPI